MVDGMTFVDQSVDLVRRVVTAIGKKPLARRADVPPRVLRKVHERDYSPHVRTLRNLETAAREVAIERGMQLLVPDDVQ